MESPHPEQNGHLINVKQEIKIQFLTNVCVTTWKGKRQELLYLITIIMFFLLVGSGGGGGGC